MHCAAVLAEGLELYNKEENKSQIDAAIAAAEGNYAGVSYFTQCCHAEVLRAGDQAKLMATATPLALTIGKPLLEKYGFTADAMGTFV